MPERVPCHCSEYEHRGVIKTNQCTRCDALELLRLTRSDVEHLPLLHACNRALSERCVRLEKERDGSLGKERETRRVANSYMADKRLAVYALREAGIDDNEAAVLAKRYKDRHQKPELSSAD